jgi:hypothetical protein
MIHQSARRAEFDQPKCTEAEFDPPKGRFSLLPGGIGGSVAQTPQKAFQLRLFGICCICVGGGVVEIESFRKALTQLWYTAK